jgi:Flp pilus assembly protein CpaB
MKNNRIIYIGAAILGLGLIAVLAPNAVPATNATLTASVVDQVCQGGGRR